MTEPIPLWVGDSSAPPESISSSGMVTNVSRPALVPFLAPPGRGDGTAILVCPGGGYGLLDWQSHVVRLAARFNPLGIAVLGLRYRTAPPSTRVPEDALDDLRNALREIGNHATRWGIRADRIIGLGFSAGANLLLRHIASPDPAGFSGTVLLCLWPHGRSASDYPLAPHAPRTLLCVSAEDPVAPVNFSRSIAESLRLAGCDSTLTVYPTGGHLAFNFRPDGTPEIDWTPAFLAWLAHQR